MLGIILTIITIFAGGLAVSNTQMATVPNNSFEEGIESPDNWSLSGGDGAWENTAHTGERSVSVTGDGSNSNHWRCNVAMFEPEEVYKVTFYTKVSPGSSGGTIVSGPSFANRDYGAGVDWEKKAFIFKSPKAVKDAYLRFGQWQKTGKVWFDDISLVKVMPIHCRHLASPNPDFPTQNLAKHDGMTLGANEMIKDGVYVFQTHLNAEYSNYSRACVEHTSGFNSDRWTFGDDTYTKYKLEAGNYEQIDGKLTVNMNYHIQGECVVEASRDDEDWQEVARLDEVGPKAVELPGTLYPTDAFYIRLAGTGVFQVNSIRYESNLAGQPPDVVGQTWFLELEEVSEDIAVDVQSLGDLLPGAENLIVAELANRTELPKRLIAKAEIIQDTGKLSRSEKSLSVEAEKDGELQLPYEVTSAGQHTLIFSIADAETGRLLYSSRSEFSVPSLHDVNFGYALPCDEFDLWWCEGTYKVSRRRIPPNQKADFIEIRAARNEYEPFQLVIRPQEHLEGVTVEVTDLRESESGKAIGKENISIKLVDYVHVEIPSDVYGCVGDYPDPLPVYEESLDLPAKINQPIWFTVYVPEDADPGTYEGQIRVGAMAAVPLRLKVWDFALPEETHTKTAYGMGVDRHFHGLKEREDILKVHDLYMQNARAHRVSTYGILDPTPIRWEVKRSEGRTCCQLVQGGDIRVEFDFEDFDKAARKYLDGFKFNGFRFPVLPGKIEGHERFTPEYDALHVKIYGQIAEHLEENGWLDKAYCYWFDEPGEEDYDYVIRGMKLLEKTHPGLRRLLTEQPEPPLYDCVDIWVPVLNNYNEERAKERQAAGQDVWWYVCCVPKAPYPNNFIDHPAINHRIRFWMIQKYGVTGSLYWSTTYYRGASGKVRNPWATAMSYSPSGTMWGNGDGMLVYPPVREPSSEPVIEGPVDSIRWEMIREGLEDREYFWLLEQEIAQLRRKRAGMTDSAVQKRLDELTEKGEEALKLVDSLCRSLTDYEKDPLRLYNVRAKIAEAIEMLRQE